jgi:hypothetical protein
VVPRSPPPPISRVRVGHAGNSRTGRHGCIDRGTGAARAGNTEITGSSAPTRIRAPGSRYARRAFGPRPVSCRRTVS